MIQTTRHLETHFELLSVVYSRAKWSTILAELKRLGLTYVRDERCEYLEVDPGGNSTYRKCRGCVHGLVVRDMCGMTFSEIPGLDHACHDVTPKLPSGKYAPSGIDMGLTF